MLGVADLGNPEGSAAPVATAHESDGREMSEMREKWLAVLFAFAVLGAGAPRAGAVSLFLSPETQSVTQGNLVSIDIIIDELGAGVAPTLAAFDLDVTFDPSVLGFVSVVFGSALGNPALFEALTSSSLLGGPVRVDLAEASLLSNAVLDASQPASFVLATIQFTALALGEAQLAITQAVLANTAGGPGANQITADLFGASVTVTAIPEPATLAMLVAGLIGLARLRTPRR